MNHQMVIDEAKTTVAMTNINHFVTKIVVCSFYNGGGGYLNQ